MTSLAAERDCGDRCPSRCVTFARFPQGNRPGVATRRRGPLADDDLWSGFDRSGPQREELRGFFAATMAGSLYAWEMAFEFSTHHAVFYQRVQQILVLSLTVLVGLWVVQGRVRVHVWVRAAFLPPVLLFLFRLSTPEKNLNATTRIVDDGLVVVNIVAFPFILLILGRLLAPEYFALRTRRLRVASILMVAAVAVVGYLAGRYNYRLLTCHDFTITGAEPPANCRQSGHP
jgi:hypothetical protein